MSTDVTRIALCPVCEKLVDQEGSGIPAWLLHEGEFYHTRCAPQFCEHETHTICDWRTTDSDTVEYTYRCRSCDHTWTDERIGSVVRAEEEAENEG